MVMRYLLAMLLALTGFMVATSPVAAFAMSGRMLCDQRLEAAAAHPTQGHVDHAQHEMSANEIQETEQALPVCCDHACLFDAPALPASVTIGASTSKFILAWPSSDLIDLTDPAELRRPPKA